MAKKMVFATVLIAVCTAAGAAFGAVNCDGTNVWIGPVTGGSWKDPANWEAKTTKGYTVEQLFTQYTVYDFSSLQNGAVVTNDYEGGNAYNVGSSTGNTFVYGFVFSGNAGDTWTLADGTVNDKARIRFCEPSYIDVTGGTLDFRAKMTTNSDYPKPLNTYKRGTGALRWGWPSAYFWESTFIVNAGTEVFTNNTNFTCCNHELKSGAKLLVTYGKNRLGSLFTGSAVSADTAAEIAEGATLDLATSFNTYSPNFYGDFLGTGTLSVRGGGSFAFQKGNKTGPFSFAGLLRPWNADMTFGTASVPVGVNPAVSVSIEASGRVGFTDDQSVKNLSGTGTDGGVSVPSDKTLTVTGAAGVSTSLVYAARLSGGGFTKDGADLTLTLTGASRNTGATRVKAGTLALKRTFVRPDLAAVWSFEDAVDMGVERRGVAALRMTNELTFATEETLGLVPGVAGQALRFKGGSTDALKMKGTILHKSVAADGKLPSGNDPFTISFWMRPDTSGCGSYPNFLRFWDGNWNGLKGIWFRTPSDTFRSLVMSTENGWNIGPTNAPNRAVVADFGSNTYLGDGNWHHVAGTYSNQVITLYVDGVSRGSNNLGANMNIPAAALFRVGNYSTGDTRHKFAGDIDEIQIFRRAWTAAEVAAEYAAKRPKADASLPAPVARWTFDEQADEGGTKLFKDSGPNGWDLVNTPSNGVYVSNPAMTYPEDFGGRYAALASSAGPYLRLKSGVTMTDALPQGSSFTVSARVRYPANGVVLIFGDGTSAGSYRLGYSGCPRNIVAYVGANTCTLSETSMYGNSGSSPDTAWQLVTATYDATAKTVRTFLDGVLMNELTGMTVTINPTDLSFGAKSLPAAYGDFTYACIDELRVYDRALEPDEVIRLARTFRYGDGTAVDDPVLSAASPVTVDAGATLEATDGDHAAKSVSGAGTVSILGPASFAAADWSGFTGTVSGNGALLVQKGQTVPLAAENVTADARFEDDTVVLSRASAATPLVKTSGRVFLPDTGTLKLADALTPGAWFGKTFVIAECESYEGPSDTTGWTFDPAAEVGKPIDGDIKFVNGKLILQTKGGGTAVIIW